MLPQHLVWSDACWRQRIWDGKLLHISTAHPHLSEPKLRGNLCGWGLDDEIGSKHPSADVIVRACADRKAPNVGAGENWDLGAQGGSAKALARKQCAWRKHGSCDTRLAEAWPS